MINSPLHDLSIEGASFLIYFSAISTSTASKFSTYLTEKTNKYKMASYGRAASKDYVYSEDIEKTITNFKKYFTNRP